MTIRRFKTGVCREQGSLLPPRVDDYVGPDNPVRVIAAYVGTLDVAALGFRHADREVGAGQPPYDPADLLGLYLYGYLNQVRSSRRLEREARRNVEVMWLLKGLVPCYRTIGEFRKDNAAALQAANRGFVRTLHELELLSGDVVAIDGAFFHGDASKASIVTGRRLAEQLAALDQTIEAYGVTLDANDAAEAMRRRWSRPARWRIVWRRWRRSGRRRRRRWIGWRPVARRSCRAPTPMHGCCRRPGRRWRATTCRLRWMRSTS